MFKEEQLAPDDTESFVYLCSNGENRYLSWYGEVIDPSLPFPQARVTADNSYIELDEGAITDLGDLAANISGSDFGGVRNMNIPNISDVANWIEI